MWSLCWWAWSLLVASVASCRPLVVVDLWIFILISFDLEFGIFVRRRAWSEHDVAEQF